MFVVYQLILKELIHCACFDWSKSYVLLCGQIHALHHSLPHMKLYAATCNDFSMGITNVL